eukprot:6456238-Amphidinium_carterae.1
MQPLAQVVVKGTTTRSHPTGPLPEGLSITHTDTHWASQDSIMEFLALAACPGEDWPKHASDIVVGLCPCVCCCATAGADQGNSPVLPLVLHQQGHHLHQPTIGCPALPHHQGRASENLVSWNERQRQACKVCHEQPYEDVGEDVCPEAWAEDGAALEAEHELEAEQAVQAEEVAVEVPRLTRSRVRQPFPA